MTYLMDTPDEGRRIEAKTDRVLLLEQLRWTGLRPAMRVLDLGCAAGTTTRLIADLIGPGGCVVGVDVSRHRIEEARRHPGPRPTTEYREGEASAIPARDAEFDLAWSRFLFEYLPDPAAALAEMIRVTRPGGTVPARRSGDRNTDAAGQPGTARSLRTPLENPRSPPPPAAPWPASPFPPAEGPTCGAVGPAGVVTRLLGEDRGPMVRDPL